jgi:YidC/Oxa1 family membrane protein insertase
MEDRKTALALFLCIVFIMAYSEMVISPLTRPQVPPQSAATQAPVTANSNVSNAPVTNASSPVVVQQPLTNSALGQQDKKGYPSRGEIEAAGTIRVESPTVSATLTKLGGRLSSYRLKNYKRTLGSEELVDMISVPDGAPLPLAVRIGTSVSDDFVPYFITEAIGGSQVSPDTISVPGNTEATIKLAGTLPNGIAIAKTLRFRADGYMFDVEVSLAKPNPDSASLWLEWSHFISDLDLAERLDPLQYSLLSASTNKLQHLLLPDIVKAAGSTAAGSRELGDNAWVALANKYFMSALIPTATGPNSRLVIENNVFMNRAQGGVTEGKFSMYAGPKDYRILSDLGFGLHRSIDLGIFSFLAFPLIAGIRFFEQVLGNYGLAIILLTLLIKAAFLPLTKASFESMRAMQDIQPEVKALRDRIKDSTQLNQEMMALYKRKGVNPMGGCLPMLIQIPVFLGLYNALLYSIELRHAPFALWINDLSTPERLMMFGVPVPVMILLMGASMFFQQLTSPQPTADPAQRKVMMMMPVVFTIMFVIFPFPSGLVLYWLVNNVISIIQQVYLRSHRKSSPLVATVVASVCIFCFGFVLTLLSK